MRDWVICIKMMGGRGPGGQGHSIRANRLVRWYTLISRVLCCSGLGLFVSRTGSLVKEEKKVDSKSLRESRTLINNGKTDDD